MTAVFPKFATHPGLSPKFKGALAKMQFTHMTEIQAKTFEAAVTGRDVLGRAKTGSGKTVAFLLPALERIMASRTAKNSIAMLVLSPTRELAQQIGEQARLLAQQHSAKEVSYQVMVGGTSKPKDVSKLERQVPTILVATPGRLQDHLDSTTVGGRSMKELLAAMQVLVLDETDRLLDMGFRREIDKIISFLPTKRQTLLFSATIPDDVKDVIRKTMGKDYITVDCIHDNDPHASSGSAHTNAQVSQSHVIVEQSRVVASTVQILLHYMSEPNSKVIAFFPTANLVAFYAAILNDKLGHQVLEIHSRKSQSYREKASEAFRKSPSATLLSSDVSARGVDYPDVSHVVQFGIADSRESYIHRLGRTARAGKEGDGLLVLSDVEQGFLRLLKEIDVPVNPEMQSIVGGAVPSSLSSQLAPIFDSITRDTEHRSDFTVKAIKAYISMLGFYNTNLKARCGVKGSDALVEFCNGFSAQLGFVEPPPIEAKTVGKMGLKGVPGLNISGKGMRRDNGFGGGGRGGGGRGGGARGRGGGQRGQGEGRGRGRGNSGSNGGHGSTDEPKSPPKRANSTESGGRGRKRPNRGGRGRGGRNGVSD